MTLLKWIGGGVVGLIALLVVIGFFMPGTMQVERSVTVSASKQTVYELTSDFNAFNSWSPWYNRDPETVYKISDPSSGVGATMHWQSDDPDVGNGYQEITAAEPHDRVETKLAFGEGEDVMEARSAFVFDAVAGGTRVTWTLQSELGWNPIIRLMGPMIEGAVAKDYETGLENLKRVAEGGAGQQTGEQAGAGTNETALQEASAQVEPVPEPSDGPQAPPLDQGRYSELPDPSAYGLDAQIAAIPAQRIAFVRIETKADSESVGLELTKAYTEVTRYVLENELRPVGPPLAVNRGYDGVTVVMDVGMPIAPMAQLRKDEAPVEQNPMDEKTMPPGDDGSAPPAAPAGGDAASPVRIGVTPAGVTLIVTHTGPYDTFEATYDKVEAYMAAASLPYNFVGSWESYIDDPTKVETEALRTLIYFPLDTEE